MGSESLHESLRVRKFPVDDGDAHPSYVPSR